MFGKIRIFHASLLALVIAVGAGSEAIGQEQGWRVSKSSGDAWITTTGAQPVSLSDEAVLKPGDSIRTGQNGRVLLARGAETLLITANSVVGIPAARKEGSAATTILQQAGAILLDVEKKNVQHFEVETPYLAAVVKGTQFRVTVNNTGSHVDVIRGQVQVTDYRSGQYALVNRDQVASVSTQGQAGLSLSGLGNLMPVQQGMPRQSSVAPIAIPRDGFLAPTRTPGPQFQMPPLERRAQWTPSSSSSQSSKDDGWLDGLISTGRSMFGLNGKRTRDDDITMILAVPVVIGFGVAVGAAALRRKNKNKQDPNGR